VLERCRSGEALDLVDASSLLLRLRLMGAVDGRRMARVLTELERG
jgi:hypothetical protein